MSVISLTHIDAPFTESLAEVVFHVKLMVCGIIIYLSAMNYQQACNWVLGFTDYEQLPGVAYSAANFDLRRMEELLNRLGNPHLKTRTVHIAGSKGKGSTAAMIAAVLGEAGYTTGLYTSPHLHTIRERISVSGQMVTERQFTALVERLVPEVEEVNRSGTYGCLTTFELLTTMAFIYFREKKVDYQIIEVGLGGRLDATNVVAAEVSIITSISMDHVAVLGSTIAEISREKAGIIKTGGTVICSPQRPEAMAVIEEVCQYQGAGLIKVEEEFILQQGKVNLKGQSCYMKGRNTNYRLEIPLLGKHQLENAAAAVAALEVLGINAQNITRGFLKVRWPGRLEILQTKPVLLVDGAHNPDSIKRLIESIKLYFKYKRLILIIGVSSDKDIVGIVSLLTSLADIVIIARSRHPRSADPAILVGEFARNGINARGVGSVSEAVLQALESADAEDLICATGSLFIVAEVIEYMKGLSPEVCSL